MLSGARFYLNLCRITTQKNCEGIFLVYGKNLRIWIRIFRECSECQVCLLIYLTIFIFKTTTFVIAKAGLIFSFSFYQINLTSHKIFLPYKITPAYRIKIMFSIFIDKIESFELEILGK